MRTKRYPDDEAEAAGWYPSSPRVEVTRVFRTIKCLYRQREDQYAPADSQFQTCAARKDAGRDQHRDVSRTQIPHGVVV